VIYIIAIYAIIKGSLGEKEYKKHMCSVNLNYFLVQIRNYMFNVLLGSFLSTEKIKHF